MLGSHRALLKLKAQSHCSLSRLHRMGCGKDPLAIGKEPAESKGWPKEDSNDWRTSSQGLHVFACEELREWCHLSAQAVIMPQLPITGGQKESVLTISRLTPFPFGGSSGTQCTVTACSALCICAAF